MGLKVRNNSFCSVISRARCFDKWSFFKWILFSFCWSFFSWGLRVVGFSFCWGFFSWGLRVVGFSFCWSFFSWGLRLCSNWCIFTGFFTVRLELSDLSLDLLFGFAYDSVKFSGFFLI